VTWRRPARSTYLWIALVGAAGPESLSTCAEWVTVSPCSFPVILPGRWRGESRRAIYVRFRFAQKAFIRFAAASRAHMHVFNRLPKWSPRCGGCDERDDRGGGEGALSICHEDSADTYSLVENVKTLPGARTMALDRKTGVVYLPVADVGAAPASTADNPRPRRRMVPGTFSVLAVGR
jgi:hypothetical protein